MSQKKGYFILSAGANASGKTTIIKPKYIEGRAKHYLDPDRLSSDNEPYILSEKALKEYQLGRPDRFAVACMKDWLSSELIRNEGIATESNLVSRRDFINFKTAKEVGMRTELYFVGLPLEMAKEREKIRVEDEEQEKVKNDDLIQRYEDGLFNIQKHIDAGNIDRIMIYDNSRGKGEEYLLLHIENGKTVYLHPEQPTWFKEAQIKIPIIAQDSVESGTRI